MLHLRNVPDHSPIDYPAPRPRIAGLVSRLLVAVAIWLSAVGWAGAQAPEDSGSETAPVIVDGRVLFKVRGVEAYPAARRAREIAERIKRLARDPSFDPNSLRTEDRVDRADILAGDQFVMAVFDIDALPQGVNRRLLSNEVYRIVIAQTIEAYRHDRELRVVLMNILQALIRTAVLAALLFGVFWAFRRLDRVLEQHFKRKIKELEAKSLRIVQSEQVWAVLRGVLRVVHVVLLLILTYIFVNFVLSLFPWTRYVGNTLLRLVVEPLGVAARAVLDYIPSLVFLVVLFFVIRYALKMLHAFFNAVDRERLHVKNFEPEWAWPTYRILRVVVLVFAVVLAYPHIPGSGSEAFKGISILFGVLFSLGSTSLISNVIAGYTMTYRRAFKVGDRIRIGDTVGDVMEMRLMVTHLRSLKNEEIVVPNSAILNSEITNYSALARDEGLILHTRVGIGYEVPWRQVEAMLILAAERTAGLLREPRPFVLQQALADFAVVYELNVYCADEKQMPRLYSELHRNIQDVFNEYGVQIMTPAYEADTKEPKVVPKEQWYAEPAKPAEGHDG